ncbi:phosphoribosyl-AMP cyclohydrolase [bacterium]|nr:MAG: phosphoribosyl-AMP cyclohydrolase [bacterium]
MVKPDFQKSGGLIPAVAQDAETGEVLMLAYMNEEALRRTIETKKAWYYSRSRDKYWMKGESSGNVQLVKELRLDCDMDAIVMKIEQVGGAACHTGHKSCFFMKWDGNDWTAEGEILFNPEEVYKK